MGDEAVPDDALHPLGKGRDAIRIDLWNDHHEVATSRSMAGRPPDDAEYLGAALLGEIDRLHQVDADIARGIAAAHGKDHQRVLGPEATDIKPAGEDRVPPLIIGASGELRDVVDRRVGLDATELAKIVDGVAA